MNEEKSNLGVFALISLSLLAWIALAVDKKVGKKR
jgi:hypothetical protein